MSTGLSSVGILKQEERLSDVIDTNVTYGDRKILHGNLRNGEDIRDFLEVHTPLQKQPPIFIFGFNRTDGTYPHIRGLLDFAKFNTESNACFVVFNNQDGSYNLAQYVRLGMENIPIINTDVGVSAAQLSWKPQKELTIEGHHGVALTVRKTLPAMNI